MPGSAAGRARSAVVNFVAIAFTNDSALVGMPGGVATPMPEDVRTPIRPSRQAERPLSLGSAPPDEPTRSTRQSPSAPLESTQRRLQTQRIGQALARPLKDPPDRLSTRLL